MTYESNAVKAAKLLNIEISEGTAASIAIVDVVTKLQNLSMFDEFITLINTVEPMKSTLKDPREEIKLYFKIQPGKSKAVTIANCRQILDRLKTEPSTWEYLEGDPELYGMPLAEIEVRSTFTGESISDF